MPAHHVTELEDSSHFQADVAFGAFAGWLGGRTNGATAEHVGGFRIESDTTRVDDEVSTGIWFKALAPDSSRTPHQFLFTQDLPSFERVVAAIVEAATAAHARPVAVPGEFDGWRNAAQLAHDEDAEEEVQYDLACKVARVGEGMVEVVLLRSQGQPVARILADVDQAAAVSLSEGMRALTDQVAAARRRLTEVSPAPSM